MFWHAMLVVENRLLIILMFIYFTEEKGRHKIRTHNTAKFRLFYKYQSVFYFFLQINTQS